MSDLKETHSMWNPRTALCIKFERKLAACRAFIQDAIDMNHIEDSHKQAAQEILNQTKP
jgi:hypothetical protein